MFSKLNRFFFILCLLALGAVSSGMKACSTQQTAPQVEAYCQNAYSTKKDAQDCNSYCFTAHSKSDELTAACQVGQESYLSLRGQGDSQALDKATSICDQRYGSDKGSAGQDAAVGEDAACQDGATVEMLRTTNTQPGGGSAVDRETGR